MWNNDFFNNIAISSITTIPIIVALTQVLKGTRLIKDQYAPIVSILIGIGISFLMSDSNDQSTKIMAGILYGLASSGLYSGLMVNQKSIVNKYENKVERDRLK